MRKSRALAAGVALGMMLAMGAQVFAGPAIEKAQAYINHEMSFEFDGEKTALPEGYQVLVYEGRSYVPAKFVAEKLGASVDWNDETKVISISSAAVKAPEAEKPQEPEEPADRTSYKKLPQTRDSDKYRLSVTSLYEEKNSSNYDKLQVTLVNSSAGPVVLEQSAAVFKAGGKEYRIPANDYGMLDQNWYAGVLKDEETNGYILLPKELKKTDRFTLTLTVRSNGEYPAWEQELDFDIDLGRKSGGEKN